MSSTEKNKKSPTKKSRAGDRQPLFTSEGLPIDHALFGTARTTASVAEGPMRRVSVGEMSALMYAPSTKSSLAALAKPPTTSVKAAASFAADQDAAFAPTNLSLKEPSSGGRRLNKRSHPFRSSLLDEEDIDDKLEAATQRPAWSTLLYDVLVLPILPSVNHPLEKTSVTVKGVAPSIIAARISSALQKRSITASHPSPHKVNCVSSANVEFCIFLYRQGSSEHDGIIVELQRRDGFDVSYMTDVHAILDAASGENKEGIQENSSWPMYFAESSDDGEEYQVPPLLSQTFKREDPSVEEVSLCLSSMASLTNEDKVGHNAIQLSRRFLVSEECKELRSKVFSLIEFSNESSTSRSTLQALEILANVCSCTRDSSKVLKQIFSNDEIPRHLVAHIENAQNSPMAAAYSCVIFTRLAKEHSIANDVTSRLTAALFNAVSLGGEIHSGLERHAVGCLSVMST